MRHLMYSVTDLCTTNFLGLQPGTSSIYRPTSARVSVLSERFLTNSITSPSRLDLIPLNSRLLAVKQPWETRVAFGHRHYSNLRKEIFCQISPYPRKKSESSNYKNKGEMQLSGTTSEKRRSREEYRRQVNEATKAIPKNAPVKSSLAYLQILGTGIDTEDTVPSVLLFFDNRRYIFNAGEGLQRFCLQHRIRFSKIDHVFLTRINSETAGGIPGFLLTLASMEMKVKISGPTNLDRFFDAMRTFIPQAILIDSHNFGAENPSISPGKEDPSNETKGRDEVLVLDDPGIVKISAITLRSEKYKTKDELTKEISQQELNDLNSRKIFKRRRSWSEGKEDSPFLQESPGSPVDVPAVPVVPASDFSAVYICELPATQGKFDPIKAKSLGVMPGMKYGILQRGISVMSDDGTKEIQPSDVMTPPVPGAIILLVDCPTENHFKYLQDSKSLERFYGTSQVSLVVHLSPLAVTEEEAYRNFMVNLGPQAHHILAGYGRKQSVPPVLSSSARVTAQLNLICPPLFPAVGLGLSERFGRKLANQKTEIPSPKIMEDEELAIYKNTEGMGKVLFCQNLVKYNLRPLSVQGLDFTSVPPFFKVKWFQEDLEKYRPEVVEESKNLSQLWADLVDHETVPEDTQLYRESMEDDWIAAHSLSSTLNQKTVESTSAESGKLLESTTQKLSEAVLLPKYASTDAVPKYMEGIGREDLEIVFLGTGSSMPSKYRNVSAIFMQRSFLEASFLVDCGEGTLGQLRRRYGPAGAELAIQRLKFIWISHIHADHHVGILRILTERRRILSRGLSEGATCPPLLVVGPTPLRDLLEAYRSVEELNFTFLDCRETLGDRWWGESGGLLGGRRGKTGGLSPFWLKGGFRGGTKGSAEGFRLLKTVLEESGLANLESVPVFHCKEAFGLAIEAKGREETNGESGGEEGEKRGWKVVYSGDTRPCEAMVEASRGATLLIHEATFDDGMRADAVAKKHSMTGEAIRTGMDANVYRIILTHFSQRYPKIPVIDEKYTDRTCIAFDMMTVNLADLPQLPLVLPYFRKLFPEELIRTEEAEEEAVVS